MKKRMYALVMCFVILLSLFSASSVVLAKKGITVKLDEKTLKFDVQPKIINGRTMVPMRVIFEELGAVVSWDGHTKTITADKNNLSVKLVIGKPSIQINNGTPKALDAAPILEDSRTLVPVRAVSEAFQMNVDWDAATQTVIITSPNVKKDAFNKLRDIVKSKGVKASWSNNTYSMSYKYNDKPYTTMEITFNPLDGYGTETRLKYTPDGYAYNTLELAIYKETSPTLKYRMPYGNINPYSTTGPAYYLYGTFPYANKPFVKTDNLTDIPDNMLNSEQTRINTYMKDMDKLLKEMTGMTLSELGIYYKR